jgi:hypothetical protein
MRRGLVILALLALSLTACTDGSADVPTVAGTASGQPSPTAGGEQAFISCMRGQGQEMIDPVPGDTSGRSSLRYEIDVHGKGSDARFQAALDKCMSLLPPPPAPEPVTGTELEQRLKYSKCMRDNGLTEFRDPDPATGRWDNWIAADDPAAEAAIRICAPVLPSPQS